MTVQWCYDSAGNTTQANIVGGPLAKPLIPAVVGQTNGDPTLRPFDLPGGTKAYRSTFSIVYTFQTSYSISVLGKEVKYEKGESCQVSVDLMFSGAVVADLSTNPCQPWWNASG